MTTTHATTTTTTKCDPAAAMTRSLLAYGILAGPLYVAVSLAQALTRDGFDLSRHAWSLLSNGSLGWIQITNFLLSGLMTVAFAVGLARALRPGPGSTWAPRLIGGYGLGLVAAGVFRADPALGFPMGTPADAREVSWHGMVHLAAGAIGFLCVVVACLILARRFRADGRRGWAILLRVTGILFLAAFVGIASGAGNVATVVGFVVAVILMSGVLAALALQQYRAQAVHRFTDR
jgi:hypothetical membrane protein